MLQLCFDFSGYSDMAIGLSLLFRLPINFNSPYKSTSIIEFWRRWDITLSHFLRDYLYFSLGGNRKGKDRRYLNFWLTILLGGMAGASLSFIILGALDEAYLVVNHTSYSLRKLICLTRTSSIAKTPARVLSIAITFAVTMFAWVFFKLRMCIPRTLYWVDDRECRVGHEQVFDRLHVGYHPAASGLPTGIRLGRHERVG